MARPAWTYRGARRSTARLYRLIWRELARGETAQGNVVVRLPKAVEDPPPAPRVA